MVIFFYSSRPLTNRKYITKAKKCEKPKIFYKLENIIKLCYLQPLKIFYFGYVMTKTHLFNILHNQKLKLINFYLWAPLGSLDEPTLTLSTTLIIYGYGCKLDEILLKLFIFNGCSNFDKS